MVCFGFVQFKISLNEWNYQLCSHQNFPDIWFSMSIFSTDLKKPLIKLDNTNDPPIVFRRMLWKPTKEKVCTEERTDFQIKTISKASTYSYDDNISIPASWWYKIREHYISVSYKNETKSNKHESDFMHDDGYLSGWLGIEMSEREVVSVFGDGFLTRNV